MTDIGGKRKGWGGGATATKMPVIPTITYTEHSQLFFNWSIPRHKVNKTQRR